MVKARDNQTDLYGLLFRPTNFSTAKKYPIINHVYPGPQTGSCGSRSFGAAHGDLQSLAELGFIVVCIDGMGTPWRSKKFHEFYYGDMGDATIPDQVAGMKQLAERYPWIDISKSGMYGHSGGGNATAGAMFHFPDFFKVGISESGNHDNRLYEDDWGEKWTGLLVKNADGTSNYDSQANQNTAKNLKGHLLLAHGTIDDNVPPGKYPAGRRRAHQSKQGLRPAHDPQRPPRLRRSQPVYDAPPLGLFRPLSRRRHPAARVPDEGLRRHPRRSRRRTSRRRLVRNHRRSSRLSLKRHSGPSPE